MGSLGLPEIAFIFILALLIFGPKKLPEMGRTLGRAMAEFRKATNELKRTINTELALDETPTPPALRSRRLEDPAEAPRRDDREDLEPVREAPARTEARVAAFPSPAPAADPDEPAAT
jgi:TatA/E family protein of Tat protein translocase